MSHVLDLDVSSKQLPSLTLKEINNFVLIEQLSVITKKKIRYIPPEKI